MESKDTALSIHAPLDLPMAVVIDDLHCLYLGIAKRLITLWFGSGSRGENYFIGNKVYKIYYYAYIY